MSRPYHKNNKYVANITNDPRYFLYTDIEITICQNYEVME